MIAVMEPVTLRFARTARVLADVARRLDLAAPGFRSPPRSVGLDRAMRRRGGEAVVSVKLRRRPWPAVVADMIEGVLVANDLSDTEAIRVRGELWEALAAEDLLADGGSPLGPAPSSQPGPGPDSQPEPKQAKQSRRRLREVEGEAARAA